MQKMDKMNRDLPKKNSHNQEGLILLQHPEKNHTDSNLAIKDLLIHLLFVAEENLDNRIKEM